MKFTVEFLPKTSIDLFAETHKLTMLVVERDRPIDSPDRFYAMFEHSYIKEGPLLRGAFGNGVTPKIAIKNYTKEISNKLLVVNPDSNHRQEIQVPLLR